MVGFFRKSSPKINMLGESCASELYAAVTSQSRQLTFFEDYLVPDTPQGRFEMLAVHLALMLRRLKYPQAQDQDFGTESLAILSQNLCDWIVADVEESLRSMRVSDLKLTRHLKGFIEGFYGRLLVYEKSIELGDKDMLEQAIRRNIYGVVDHPDDHLVEGMTQYVLQTWDWLLETSITQIIIDLKET